MFAYQVVLAHTDRCQQVVLRLIAPWHCATVTELLRREGLQRQYRDWSIVSFETVPLSADVAARVRAQESCRCPERAQSDAPRSPVPRAARRALGSLVDTRV
jgi:hypothetical protein